TTRVGMTASDAEQASKENGCHPRCCREPAADVAVAVWGRIYLTQPVWGGKKAKGALEVGKTEFAKSGGGRCLPFDFGRHIATKINFDHDIVSIEVVVTLHRCFAPLRRRPGGGAIREHREPSII